MGCVANMKMKYAQHHRVNSTIVMSSLDDKPVLHSFNPALTTIQRMMTSQDLYSGTQAHNQVS